MFEMKGFLDCCVVLQFLMRGGVRSYLAADMFYKYMLRHIL